MKTSWNLQMSPAERRIEILRSAGEILRARKHSSLTMREIADQLGMTKGNLYYYFRSRRDILFQCHLKSTEDNLSLLQEVQRLGASAGLRLAALIRGLVSRVIKDPYGAFVTADLDSLTKAQRRSYVGLRDQFELGVRQLIEEGVSCGEFRAADVKVRSFVILGAVNAIARWYKPDGPRSPEEIAELFAEMLVSGLTA